MNFESRDTLGAVLAGGQSRRFGSDKTRAELGGETLVERAVSRLRSVCSEVILVSSRRQEWGDLDVEQVPDAVPGHGPLAGITAAVRHASGRPTFVLACDLPFVSVSLMRFLIELAATESAEAEVGSKNLAWMPRIGARTQPLCGLYEPAALPRFEEALEHGRLGVRDLLQTMPVRIVDLEAEVLIAHAHSLLNINHPRDLRSAEELLSVRSDGDR